MNSKTKTDPIKILYAIQGTGNGHVVRAKEIIPLLKLYGDVDILISGIQSDINLGYPVKYKYKGFSFIFGKKGGVDLMATWRKMSIFRLIKDVITLPVNHYDVIINDFEPIAAWSCKIKKAKSVSLSHQCSLLFKESPLVTKAHIGKLILKYYAPSTKKLGFHFAAYHPQIFTPVIRQEIRDSAPVQNNHYTVYLPAYEDKYLISVLLKFPEINWQIFSKHTSLEYKLNNIDIGPVTNKKFTESLVNCRALLTGAGFESPAEALFLGKKLLCVPMKNQYEQRCNALSLEQMGVPIIWGSLKDNIPILKKWINSNEIIKVDYQNHTHDIVKTLFETYSI